jgi:D-alanyl-D-alanine carboxypeptidase
MFMGHDPARHITIIVWTTLVASPDGRAPAIDLAPTVIDRLSPYA